MTNIGDKVKLKKYDETIYTVVNVEDEHVRVIDGTGTQLMQVRKDFVDVVEQYIDYKQRADELENTLAYIKSHLNNLWHNGDASEHEYAYNTLKYIESLQENNNA